jgi:hypothetical protein
MKLGFEIFRHLDDGSPIWSPMCKPVPKQSEKWPRCCVPLRARYFVRDAETGEVITDTGLGTAGETDPAG